MGRILSQIKCSRISIVLVFLGLFSFLKGFSQTNTVNPHRYWSDIKELPNFYQHIDIKGGITSISEAPRFKIKNNSICLNSYMDFYEFINPALQKGDTERVKALNLYFFDTSDLDKLRLLMAVFKNVEYIQLAYLGESSIKDLPVELFSNLNLRGLALNGNFAILPPQISNLKKLEYLQIASDKLTALPEQISNLTQLKSLYLTGDLGFKGSILPFYRYRVYGEETKLSRFKVNFSEANCSKIKKLPDSLEIDGIKYMMLKFYNPLKFAKFKNGIKYFGYLYIYPKAIFNKEDKIISDIVLLDKSCIYENLIIKELITDSLARLKKLKNCYIYEVKTISPYGKYYSIDEKNKLHKQNGSTIKWFMFWSFFETTSQFGKSVIDFSKYPNIFKEGWYEKSSTTDTMAKFERSMNMKGCFDQNVNNLDLFIGGVRWHKEDVEIEKLIKRFKSVISIVYIDSFDAFTIKYLKLIDKPVSIHIKNPSQKSFENLITFGKSRGFNNVEIEFQEFNEQMKEMVKQVNCRGYVLKQKGTSIMNLDLNKNINWLRSDTKVDSINLKLINKYMYQIQINAGKCNIKGIRSVEDFTILFCTHAELSFERNSFIKSLTINDCAPYNTVITKSGKNSPLIEKLTIHKLNSSVINAFKDCGIRYLNIDTLDGNFNFSEFKNMEVISVRYITKNVDKDSLVNEINKCKALQFYGGPFEHFFGEEYLLKIKENIKTNLSMRSYSDYFSKYKNRRVYISTYPSHIEEVMEWLRQIPSYNPGLNLIVR